MTSSAAVAAATYLVAIALSGWRWRASTATHLIGDEKEYVARRSAIDPYAAEPFLRTPGYIWLARRCGALHRLRLAGAMLSATACAVVAGAMAIQFGLAAGIGAGAAGALLGERVLLADRVWPDATAAAPVGFVSAGVLLLDGWAASVGLAVALSVLVAIRIDGVALTALAALVVPAQTPGQRLIVALGPLCILGGCAAAGRRRIGMLTPDTTTWFNVRVCAGRCRAPRQARSRSLNASIDDVARLWLDETHQVRRRAAADAARAIVTNPVGWGRLVVHNVGGLLGTDSFCRRFLVPKRQRALRGYLAIGFPALVALAAASIPATWGGDLSDADRASLRALSLLAIGALLAPALVLARSRFRVAVVPLIAALAGVGVDQLIHLNAPSVIAAGAGLLCSGLASRVDLEGQPSPIDDQVNPSTHSSTAVM